MDSFVRVSLTKSGGTGSNDFEVAIIANATEALAGDLIQASHSHAHTILCLSECKQMQACAYGTNKAYFEMVLAMRQCVGRDLRGDNEHAQQRSTQRTFTAGKNPHTNSTQAVARPEPHTMKSKSVDQGLRKPGVHDTAGEHRCRA